MQKTETTKKPVHTQYTVYNVTLRSISLNINNDISIESGSKLPYENKLRFPCITTLLVFNRQYHNTYLSPVYLLIRCTFQTVECRIYYLPSSVLQSRISLCRGAFSRASESLTCTCEQELVLPACLKPRLLTLYFSCPSTQFEPGSLSYSVTIEATVSSSKKSLNIPSISFLFPSRRFTHAIFIVSLQANKEMKDYEGR